MSNRFTSTIYLITTLAVGVFVGVSSQTSKPVGDPEDVVRARRFELVDEQGNLRALLGFDRKLTGGNLEFAMLRSDGSPTIRLTSYPDGSDGLASISVGGDSSEGGSVCLYVGSGKAGVGVVRTAPRLSRIDLEITEMDGPLIAALGLTSGKSDARLITGEAQTLLQMRDSKGTIIYQQPAK